MCGIAGSYLFKDFHTDLKQANARMVDALSHRGPDYHAVVDLGAIQLGHSRLAVIDLETHANQPMFSQDKRYWIVFNGEIYNYIELRQELQQLGCQFVTHSDTEVILQAWSEWQEASLQKLTGMFAFAIWDQQEQCLFLARDRMGEKPLYYTSPKCLGLQDGGVIFASELMALTQHPLVSKQINYQAINQFLSLNYILTNQCIYQSVYKLPPAHFMLFQKNVAPKLQCYWDLASFFHTTTTNRTFSSAEEQWKGLFSQTVAQQMRSDVKFGSFLSGGIDSSAITASMASARKASEINTYSIDFAEKSYSEAKYSQDVADYLQVNHHIKTVDLGNSDQLIAAMSCYGEPFADTSAIPCYYLAKYARENVTVCLSGDGGDECFAGYETYAADQLFSKFAFLPKFIFPVLAKMTSKFVPASFNKVNLGYKLQQFMEGAQYDYRRAHYTWRQIFSEKEKRLLCHPGLLESFLHDPYEDYAQYYKAVEGCDPLNQFLYVDMKTWLADDILVKVDRSSMAHSLEVRAPFLDRRLVEFAAKLPVNLKLNGREKKYFLKKSQEGCLPASIIHRKKSGFGAPVSRWLTDQLYEVSREVLFSQSMRHYFNTDYINRLWNDHKARRADNGYKLFGLLCLGLWLHQRGL